MARVQTPVCRIRLKRRQIVQSVLIFGSSPFANFIHNFFKSPYRANTCYLGVVVFHSHKRATRGRLDIRLTAEVLDYSFTRAVSSRSDMECTPLLFLTVKPYLSERQMHSQLIHGGFRDKHLITAYCTV